MKIELLLIYACTELKTSELDFKFNKQFKDYIHAKKMIEAKINIKAYKEFIKRLNDLKLDTLNTMKVYLNKNKRTINKIINLKKEHKTNKEISKILSLDEDLIDEFEWMLTELH